MCPVSNLQHWFLRIWAHFERKKRINELIKIIYIENPIYSKYLPNLSYDVILELNNLNDDLYLICVQYDIFDIQFGISETSLIGETPIENAYRGIREELQIELNKDYLLKAIDINSQENLKKKGFIISKNKTIKKKVIGLETISKTFLSSLIIISIFL